MQEKSKRSLVFGIVAAVALGSTIASAGIGGRARGKFAEARSQLVPAAAKSETRTPVIPEYKLGAQELDAARLSGKLGDRPRAVNGLVRVLERADRIDRAHSLVASLVASKLFDGVADLVDADPALLDDSRLVSALRRTSFGSSNRPLQGERLVALGVLAEVPSQVPLRTMGLAESTTTQAMGAVDAALHAMEDAAVAGDLAECERAAVKPTGLAKQVMVGPSVCRHTTQVVASGHRFERLQRRAFSHADRPVTKTARVPVTL